MSIVLVLRRPWTDLKRPDTFREEMDDTMTRKLHNWNYIHWNYVYRKMGWVSHKYQASVVPFGALYMMIIIIIDDDNLGILHYTMGWWQKRLCISNEHNIRDSITHHPHAFWRLTWNSYTSSSSSTIGRDDWWTVGELLEVKASTQESKSRGDSLRNVRHIGVSNPRWRTMNPGCLPPGSLSTHVFLKLRTPNGLHTFFCGYSTAKCSSDVLYTLTCTDWQCFPGPTSVMLPLIVSGFQYALSADGSCKKVLQPAIAMSAGIFGFLGTLPGDSESTGVLFGSGSHTPLFLSHRRRLWRLI